MRGLLSVKHWQNDQGLRSIAKNTGLLAVSKAFSAVAVLITMAIAARALGATQIGWVLLVHSFAMAASSLTHFQSWQVIVRYGGKGLAEGDTTGFINATSFAMGLDLASGLIGMVASMALLPIVAPWFSIPSPLIPYAVAYCLLIPVMGSAAATGILRTLDRFDLISWQGPIQAYLRLGMVLVAFSLDLPILAYLIAWFVSDLIGDLYLWYVALRELRRRSLLARVRPRLSSSGLEGGWRFAVSVNLTASLNSAWGPVASLLIGGLLSPAATSLYRVASNLVAAAQSPIDLMSKAVHPELMRYSPESRRPWQLMFRTIALSTGVAVIGWFLLVGLGQYILELFGPEFSPAYSLLVVLMVLPAIATLSSPLPAMLYVCGRPAGPLHANLLATILFLASLPLLTEHYGLIGAGVALVAAKLVSLIFMSLLLAKLHGTLRRDDVAL